MRAASSGRGWYTIIEYTRLHLIWSYEIYGNRAETISKYYSLIKILPEEGHHMPGKVVFNKLAHWRGNIPLKHKVNVGLSPGYDNYWIITRDTWNYLAMWVPSYQNSIGMNFAPSKLTLLHRRSIWWREEHLEQMYINVKLFFPFGPDLDRIELVS